MTRASELERTHHIDWSCEGKNHIGVCANSCSVRRMPEKVVVSIYEPSGICLRGIIKMVEAATGTPFASIDQDRTTVHADENEIVFTMHLPKP